MREYDQKMGTYFLKSISGCVLKKQVDKRKRKIIFFFFFGHSMISKPTFGLFHHFEKAFTIMECVKNK